MAYFSNGSEGMVFDHQCSICRYGQLPCPIALVQLTYNYGACNNEVASKILDTLVKDDGTCTMFEEFRKDFSITGVGPLFPEYIPEIKNKENS